MDGRGKGLIPRIDLRHRAYPLPARLVGDTAQPLPDWVDLRGDAHGAGAVNYVGGQPTQAAPLGPPENQGGKNACVGYTDAVLIAAYRVMAGLPWVRLSPDFLWQLARDTEGTTGQNTGVAPDDAWAAARDVGVPSIDAEPESDSSITTRPSAEQRAEASLVRIGSWHVVPDWQTAKRVLAAGYPLGCMIPAYASYDNTGRDGVIDTRTIEGDIAQPPNHETIIAGYWSGYGILQGSWGTTFGAHGAVLVPEPYMDRFCQYAQVAVLATPTLPPAPPA